MKKPLESMKPAYPTRRPSPCSLFLGGALLVALVIIILLLLRNPSYVYAQLTPFSTTDSRISVDEKSLRPLPSVISLGQRVEADILPQHMTNTLGRLSSIHGAGGYQLRFIRANESHCTIETPSGQRTVLVTSIYDGVIESVQTGIGEPIRLNYLPGGLLISQSQGGAVTVYEYNDKGRVTAMRNDGKEFRIVDEKVKTDNLDVSTNFALFPIYVATGQYTLKELWSLVTVLGGWVTTNVLRNGDPYATFTSRTSEVAFDDSSSSRVIYMDDGFSVLHGGMTSLLDANTHPVHGESSVLKIKTTIDTLQENPSRRSLTSRFDWRPFVKRGGAERRVAEVGARPRVNGVNVFTVTFDRVTKSDVISAKSEDETLHLMYMDSGELRQIVQEAPVDTDAVTYDRQNRVVERTTSDFVSTKFAYHKELRYPSMIELPGGSRIPFTKKPFVAAEDFDGRLLEWTTADELHHVLLQRDKYDRVVKEMCDSDVTIFTYKANELATVNSAHLEVNLTYQGPLLVTLSERRQARNGWLDSSFAVEHDELLRPTSIQAVISGTAVEPLLLTYDERTAFMSAYAGYQILRESTMIRIQGFKMMHETSLDIYRQPVSLKIVIGDVRISLMIIRDSVGRSIANAWRTITGDFKETRSFDAQGRLAGHEMNGKERWLFKYNNDSRLMLMNDVTYEWHAGGVPKKVGRVEYVVDGNGWTIKRGDVSFEMDGYGRLVGARGPSTDMKFDYDYQNRLISITNGATLYSLFYTLPHLPRRVSHFQSSSDSSPTSILYTEEGIPFAMNCDGYRYAIAVDNDGSLRYILSESGIEKEIHRDPLGRVISDTKTAFWTPLGFRGGVEIPQLSVVIMPSARPYDTLIGRYMSFGPDFIGRVRFKDIAPSVDPFALGALETAPLIPTDLATWFRLAGLSPSLLPPADLHLNCRQHVCARSIASFPSRLRTFSQVSSLASSDLLDATFTAMYPLEDVSFTVEDSGFHELLVLTQNGQRTNVQSLPALTANESALIKSVIEPAHETGWRVFGTSWERHLVRPDAISDSLTSASFPHFTLVVFRNTAEFRNGKTKIFVHFASDAKTVNKELVEDFRRKEGPAVWRAERRRMERGESKQQWTEREKRELLSKGAVAGYTIEMDESLRARFSSVHIWRFVKSD
ncbi:unnamed protein product [Haemonchus placei]|uniref:Uncharacterized protein n=1 Tax=Haemonchus placei TaxID=6290 RepID=A0A3P7V9C2_HAEPC|nr:unnamed protein product [Haemonchus placei]